MTDQPEETNDMPKTNNVTKLADADNWLAPVLAEASAQINGTDELSAGIAAEVLSQAEAKRSPESNGFTYDGHTESENAFINARVVALETAIADYNREITAATGYKNAVITLAEAHCADLVDRFSAKRNNAIVSLESLKAQQKVLGQ